MTMKLPILLPLVLKHGVLGDVLFFSVMFLLKSPISVGFSSHVADHRSRVARSLPFLLLGAPGTPGAPGSRDHLKMAQQLFQLVGVSWRSEVCPFDTREWFLDGR